MGEFGREYTNRNATSVEEMENQYRKNYGVTRTELNYRFLKDMDTSARILEVGVNIGNQLLCLQRMGYSHLHGIELQAYALQLLKLRAREIHTIQASADVIPFKNSSFDLVFTSGVLIHIHPSTIPKVVQEIHRCTSKYILGLEYFADSPTQYIDVSYRGRTELLWKSNYPQIYLNLFDDLELVMEERLRYLTDNTLIDTMFLLRKK
jgi:pseudaminic acid biosynthesis-associated methylase